MLFLLGGKQLLVLEGGFRGFFTLENQKGYSRSFGRVHDVAILIDEL